MYGTGGKFSMQQIFNWTMLFLNIIFDKIIEFAINNFFLSLNIKLFNIVQLTKARN